jgi:hypothetical protein
MSQYHAIDETGIQPILLQDPEEVDTVIYDEIEQGRFINCSMQQGLLRDFAQEDFNIYGHKKELY